MTPKEFIKNSAITRGVYSSFSKFAREEAAFFNPFGKRSSQSVYIIRRYDGAGFFSNFLFVLGHVIHAHKQGYIPVVDMQHYPTFYNEKTAVNGTKNAWEYYFKQPTGMSLREAYKMQRIVLSGGNMLFDEVPYYGTENAKFPDYKEVENLLPYIQKYIRFNQELLDEAERILSGWNGSVLGVHIRGTDMKYTPGHPAPPSVERYIEAIEKTGNKFPYIFLCTDEVSILERMRERFGERVVFTEAYRSDDETSIHGGRNRTGRALHNYLNGREVVMDMLLLSKCNAIICGHSNVSYTAILLNGNQYESVQLLENVY